MREVVSPKWKAGIESDIFQGKPVTVTTSFNAAAQWLVAKLVKCGVPFKLTNNGAGVKTITTVTDTCPLCKRKL
jgi:hypothetical protein